MEIFFSEYSLLRIILFYEWGNCHILKFDLKNASFCILLMIFDVKNCFPVILGRNQLIELSSPGVEQDVICK